MAATTARMEVRFLWAWASLVLTSEGGGFLVTDAERAWPDAAEVGRPLVADFAGTVAAASGVATARQRILQHYFYGVVGEKAMLNLRKALFAGVLRNELGLFEKSENSIGLVTSRIINDTAMMKVIISDRMSVIV
ncbi:hypothetical protein MLD38_019900 [Melastoma candidum]|uniref:Uncharacterized protein n=1 Tax=Melastoma candidum TaxID=119954 RepID=A0ACB9QBD1_9MYRT|nr:hypothetical protein MLD38_019900 [Melastoma candidum]